MQVCERIFWRFEGTNKWRDEATEFGMVRTAQAKSSGERKKKRRRGGGTERNVETSAGNDEWRVIKLESTLDTTPIYSLNNC